MGADLPPPPGQGEIGLNTLSLNLNIVLDAIGPEIYFTIEKD